MRSVWRRGAGGGGEAGICEQECGREDHHLPAGYREDVGESGTEERFGHVHTDNNYDVCLWRGTPCTSFRENMVGLCVAVRRFAYWTDSFICFPTKNKALC